MTTIESLDKLEKYLKHVQYEMGKPKEPIKKEVIGNLLLFIITTLTQIRVQMEENDEKSALK